MYQFIMSWTEERERKHASLTLRLDGVDKFWVVEVGGSK
jgi:hypothetical protein